MWRRQSGSYLPKCVDQDPLRVDGVFCAGDRLAIVALGVVAVLDVAFLLGFLLEKVRRGALRALTRNGAVVQREVALRVSRAGVEDAAARTALDQLSLAALRALHSGRLRRGRLPTAQLPDGFAV